MKNIIRICFKDAPETCIPYTLLKFIYGILPIFYINIYGSFLNTIIFWCESKAETKAVIYAITKIIILLLFQYVSLGFESKLEITTNLKINHKEINKFLCKNAKIAYQDLENKDKVEFFHEIKNGIEEYIFSGYVFFLDAMQVILNIFAIFITVANYSVVIACIILFCTMPIIIISLKNGDEDFDAFEKYQKIDYSMQKYLKYLVSGEYAEERKIYNYKKLIYKKWEEKYNEANNIFLDVKRKNYLNVKKVSVLIKTILWIALGLIIYASICGKISMGICVMLISQTLSMSDKITWNLSADIHEIEKAKAYSKQYIQYYNEPEEPLKTKEIKKCNKICFKNVYFKYQGSEKYALNNFSYLFDMDKVYAIVGENGAGKSTLVRLLLGLYDNYEGEIQIDDIDIKDIKSQRDILSVVFQDYAKYEMSVKENIIFEETLDSKKGEIISNAKLLNINIDESNLNEEIGKINNGKTDISGGQWQKIAMLRALNNDKQFYILDEPTAALDPNTESEMYVNFEKIINKKGAILITHRLGAVRMADEIIVINNGSIAEHGGFEELMNKKGEFYNMYEAQKAWYK